MAKNKEFEIAFGFDYICFSINSELGILSQDKTSSCTCRLNIAAKSLVVVVVLKLNFGSLMSVSLHQSDITLNITFNFLGFSRGGEKKTKCILLYMESFPINVSI